MSCISCVFYIKPQLHNAFCRTYHCCISCVFYIKPQHSVLTQESVFGCISCVFYIKPQLEQLHQTQTHVVYLAFSTSNHNFLERLIFPNMLYILRFLHQTTTDTSIITKICSLYILRFLHQTTTHGMITA